mgnify:CR=1 FL=1
MRRLRCIDAVEADLPIMDLEGVAVDHARRYTKATLRDVLERNGFAVESLWSWNVLLRPVVALRRRVSSGSDLEEIHPLVNVALRAVVTVERHVPVRALPGVTLMVTARPRP